MLTSGYLPINDALQINGPGAGQLSVNGNHSNPIFESFAASGTNISISGLTLTNGYQTGFNGGAISIGGPNLTISDSVLSGNEVAGTGGDGGAINVYAGTLKVQSSTLSGNTASESGGAIFSYGSSLTIDGSTVADNHATAFGGGGVYSGDTDLTIRNSTVSHNDALNYIGGGISTFGANPPTIQGTTIANNHAEYGGGISSTNNVTSNTPALHNTIVAGNSADISNPDLFGTFDAAFSLIQDPSGSSLSETVPGSDITGQSPQLGPLQSNGGPTQTMVPATTSPVINKGSAFGLTTDQRGLPRPFEYPGIANSSAAGADGSDIGAVELQPPSPSPSPSSPAVPSNAFSFGKLKLNKRKGTALLVVNVPGPGTLSLSGKGVVSQRLQRLRRLLGATDKTVSAAGQVKLTIKAKGKAKRKLNKRGKCKLKLTVTFTPSGGTSATQNKSVTLKKTRRR
jgi:hypothetical protein